jgi:hypothetical protein
VRKKDRSVLFNDVYSCCNYTESQRDEKYNSIENECSDIDSGETIKLAENSLLLQFSHHKPYMDWAGIET